MPIPMTTVDEGLARPKAFDESQPLPARSGLALSGDTWHIPAAERSVVEEMRAGMAEAGREGLKRLRRQRRHLGQQTPPALRGLDRAERPATASLCAAGAQS